MNGANKKNRARYRPVQLDEPFREELNKPRRTTTTKIEVSLLPYQFMNFLQNFCTHCEALLCFVLEEK